MLNYIYRQELLPSDLEEIDNFETIAVDIETKINPNYQDVEWDVLDKSKYPLDPFLGTPRLLQIGIPNKQFLFDLDYIKDLDKFNILFTDKSIIGHNLKFELKMLWSINILLDNAKYLFDLFLAETLLTVKASHNNSDNKYSLAAITSKYLGVELSKEEQTSDWGKKELSEQQLIYAAKDVEIPLILAKKIFKELNLYNLTYVAELEFKALPAIASMEYYGLPLNSNMWANEIELFTKRLASLKESCYNIFPDIYYFLNLNNEKIYNFNLDSNRQVLSKLKEMGILTDANTSVNKKVITDLSIKHPELDFFKQYNSDSSILRTQLKGFSDHTHPITGNVHASLWQLGAKTGRILTSAPNIQNLPRPTKTVDIRKCFGYKEGWKVVDADYSKFEPIISSVLANVTSLIQDIKEGRDIYLIVASKLFGKDYEELAALKKSDKYEYSRVRQYGKVFQLG
ncbi:MAG: DNA polymerase, partial [Saprospiraceae bacterium]